MAGSFWKSTTRFGTRVAGVLALVVAVAPLRGTVTAQRQMVSAGDGGVVPHNSIAYIYNEFGAVDGEGAVRRRRK
jgi:hypothetical protein